VNSFSESWVAAAEAQLVRLLRAADAALPGRVMGVWLCAGTSGEWNY
jgi:hypothetical protein